MGFSLKSAASGLIGGGAEALGSALTLGGHVNNAAGTQLTNTGHAITNPNVVLSSPAGLFTKSSAFTPVAPISTSGQNGNAAIQPAPDTAATLKVGSGSGGSGTGYSASDLAYLDSQEGILKGLLGRSGVTLSQGLANLDDSYNSQVSSADSDRTRALQDYDLQDEATTKAKDSALGSVNNNARTLADSLRRILGMSAGSDSSAYQITAPGAVARDASTKRNGVLGDYAENSQKVDLAKSRATEDFDKLLASLAEQRKSKEGDLRTGVLQNEQDVTKQIADLEAQKASGKGLSAAATAGILAPLATQVNAKQTAIDSLFDQFRTPTYNVTPVDTSPVDLKDYTVKSTDLSPDTNTASQDPTLTSAYFLKKLQDQNAAVPA